MNSILIADPHRLCREALCNYIMHVDHTVSVQGFSDVGQIMTHLKDHSADLVIVDHDLYGWDALSGVKTAVLVREANEAARVGENLHGVFPRNISSKLFLKGIRDILGGGTFFPSEESITEVALAVPRMQPQNFNLTAREKEVLSYLVKGQSNKDIARALDLQVVTVKLHVRGICRKMKAANRTQAALTAKETGWS